ncbi:MAG: hypothetical protein IT443_09870 [Phycisphaeraceae bacterium]|nr:hypothetical protein [Phycisphaeraceae bacterium]
MLKFFRKYLLNKWVLALGGVLLMVVFLMPQGGMGNRGYNPVIGRLEGKKVYQSQRAAMAGELEILGRISPVLRLTAAENDLHWMLMLHEARAMGLSGSEAEAVHILAELGLTTMDLQRLMREARVPEGDILMMLGDYAMVQRYKELVRGVKHTPIRQRLRLYATIGAQFGAAALRQADKVLPWTLGEARLSLPVLERFVYDQSSRVKVAVLPIDSRRYLPETPAPSAEELAQLFNQYRDQLPGQTEPYGIGFKSPRRVKVEYLSLPLDRLHQVVEVTEAEAIAYFRDHPGQFTPAAGNPNQGQLVAPDYRQARTQVISLLTNQRAAELADKMLQKARAILTVEDARNLPQQDGYYQIPEGWQPMALAAVADRLAEEFKVRPDVVVRDNEWLAPEELSFLPGIGQAALLGGAVMASFGDYVLSAKELEPAKDNLLLVERLQTSLPSKTLRDQEGTRYLFRLIEAQPERAPQTLEEVREQVDTAARRLAAYKMLVERHQTSWLERAEAQPLTDLAVETGVAILTPPMFPRSERSEDRGLQAPEIAGIGRSQAFVDAVFTFADKFAQQGDLSALPLASRVLAVPVDGKLALYVVRLDECRPATEQLVTQQTANPILRAVISGVLNEPLSLTDPLSFEAVSRRVNFVREGEMQDQEEGEPASAPADKEQEKS